MRPRERDVRSHLEICLHDIIDHQPGQIAIECVVSFSYDVDEGVHFSFDNQWTCYDVLSTAENDRLGVAEILCWLGVAHMNRHPEVDAIFVVEHFEDGGSQLVAKIIQVFIQICIMVVTDERLLLDAAVHCI